MSPILIGRCETPGGGALTRLAAGAERLWLAYITWRVERLAIAELHAMSDHDLNNLALPRSEIAGAVKAARHANVGSAPSALQPNPNA